MSNKPLDLLNDDFVVVLAEPGTTETGFIIEKRDAPVTEEEAVNKSVDVSFQSDAKSASPRDVVTDFDSHFSRVVSPSLGVSAAFASAAAPISSSRTPAYAPSI